MNAKALIVNFQILIKQNIGIVALKKIKPVKKYFSPMEAIIGIKCLRSKTTNKFRVEAYLLGEKCNGVASPLHYCVHDHV